MTDNERLGKIWEFVQKELAETVADIERTDSDYDWGAKTALEAVLDFMDELMD